MMPTRCDSACTSSMECVVRMMEASFCSVAMREMTDHMNRRATGSTPVEGSSKKMIWGSPTVAMATDSLRLLPPDSVPAFLFSNALRSNSRIFSATTRGSSDSRTPLMRPYSCRCSRTVMSSSSASNWGQ